MMIILCVTKCPPKLRGDLSKWLLEINTGVYIGKTSARVRDELWRRTCDNIRDAQATMIYSANNAQGYEVMVHNTKWKPIDYEGITLMRRPLMEETVQEDLTSEQLKSGFSDAAKWLMHKRKKKAWKKDHCVVLDLETTGLDSRKDRIIEIGAVRIRDGEVSEQYHRLVASNCPLPEDIIKLTGITKELISGEGGDEKNAVKGLMDFIGKDLVLGYHVQFDLDFLRETCVRCDIEYSIMKARDILQMVRKTLQDLSDFRMSTVADYLQIENRPCHRAIPDCLTAYRIYEKLNEF